MTPDSHDPSAGLHRLLIFTPQQADRQWVGDELSGQPLVLRFVGDVKEIVKRLVDDPPPRPQIAVIDVDAMTAMDVMELHSIRGRGWFGSVIALGKVSDALTSSLNIERVLSRPLARGALRGAVKDVGLDRKTTKMRRIDD